MGGGKMGGIDTLSYIFMKKLLKMMENNHFLQKN
jgi:hypothetical protein